MASNKNLQCHIQCSLPTCESAGHTDIGIGTFANVSNSNEKASNFQPISNAVLLTFTVPHGVRKMNACMRAVELSGHPPAAQSIPACFNPEGDAD